MEGAWGAGLLAATVLLFAWAYGNYRRPDPKAWTQSEALVNVICFVLTAGLVFGLGGLAAFAFEGRSAWATLDTATMALLAGGTVMCLLVARWLMAPAFREAAAAPASADVLDFPDPHPEGPASGRPASGSRAKRRAA